MAKENSKLPVPKDAFIAVLNYLALGLLVGNLEVAVFDEIIKPLIAATDGELQAELVQIELLAKRVIVDAD